MKVVRWWGKIFKCDNKMHQQVKKKIKSQAFLKARHVIFRAPDGVMELVRFVFGIKMFFGVKKHCKSLL